MASEAQRSEAIAELTILLENVERAHNSLLNDRANHSERWRNERLQSYERRIAALRIAIEVLAHPKE